MTIRFTRTFAELLSKRFTTLQQGRLKIFFFAVFYVYYKA